MPYKQGELNEALLDQTVERLLRLGRIKTQQTAKGQTDIDVDGHHDLGTQSCI